MYYLKINQYHINIVVFLQICIYFFVMKNTRKILYQVDLIFLFYI